MCLPLGVFISALHEQPGNVFEGGHEGHYHRETKGCSRESHRDALRPAASRSAKGEKDELHPQFTSKEQPPNPKGFGGQGAEDTARAHLVHEQLGCERHPS